MNGLNLNLKLIIAGVVALVLVFFLFESVATVDAHEVMVVQAPWTGSLSVYTEPGTKFVWFGKVTRYPRRADYDFFLDKADIKSNGDAKLIRFGDGAHAYLSGSVSWEMPLVEADVIKIHKTYGNPEAVAQSAVGRMLDSAIYLAGPMMTSTESSGERRAELVQLISDQAEHGVYVTQPTVKVVKDPITNVDHEVTVTQIVKDDKGLPRRQQGSILGDFNIKLLPLSINELRYDPVAEQQIAERQKATTQVQIAQANARKAEQDAITIAKQGEATAAKAKWDQETINAKQIAEAEMNLKVATLSAQQADQYKKEQILRGEGEGEYKRLIINADNALAAKLEAYTKVQGYWAEAFAKYQGNVVPTTVLGGGQQGVAGNGAQQFMELVTAKTAHDLSIDLSTAKK